MADILFCNYLNEETLYPPSTLSRDTTMFNFILGTSVTKNRSLQLCARYLFFFHVIPSTNALVFRVERHVLFTQHLLMPN